MLYKSDYEMLARHIGNAFAFADNHGASDEFYNQVYLPLCDELKADNAKFDRLKFGYAVASVRDAGKSVTRPDWIYNA